MNFIIYGADADGADSLRPRKGAKRPTRLYAVIKKAYRARALLLQGCPATEACVNCGFGDYSHFSRSFREQYGVQPGRYRAQSRPEGAASPPGEPAPSRANSSPMERANGGRSTPDSVTMAEMSPESVTSKAGL